MTYSNVRLAHADQRGEPRDEVHHRARAMGPDGHGLSLVVVNVSPSGLMARSDAILIPGDRIQVTLPALGVKAAEIRWSLGGRVGCRFERPVDRADYYEMLTVMLAR